MNSHIRCTYIIIVAHCVLLPPITSAHLATSVTTHNYIYIFAIACGQFTNHTILDKINNPRLHPKMSRKRYWLYNATYTCFHKAISISRNGLEWNGTVLSHYFLEQSRFLPYCFDNWHSIPPCVLNVCIAVCYLLFMVIKGLYTS